MSWGLLVIATTVLLTAQGAHVSIRGLRMRLASLLLALIITPTWLAAQLLAPGARVRYWEVSEPRKEIVAVFTGSAQDTLLFRTYRPDSQARVPRLGIMRMEVSTGRSRSHAKGAAVGLGLGALAGAIVGVASSGKQGICDGCRLYALDAALGGIAGGLLGLVGGAIVGIPQERWQNVPLRESPIAR